NPPPPGTGAAMIYFLALIPATVLTIAGYFVLFLSARSEGALRTFGKYLGFWAFTLAGLVILRGDIRRSSRPPSRPHFRNTGNARTPVWSLARYGRAPRHRSAWQHATR